jgi:hypothetical protein
VETNHTARRLYGLCLAVQLVPKALDVVQSIGNDNVIAREHPLHSRVFFRPRILLGLGGLIDIARDTERLVVDEMHFEAAGARIGAGTGDLGLEVLLQLVSSCGFPRRGVAFAESQRRGRRKSNMSTRDEDKLHMLAVAARHRNIGRTGIVCLHSIEIPVWQDRQLNSKCAILDARRSAREIFRRMTLLFTRHEHA